MRFPYQSYDLPADAVTGLNVVYRPVIPVRLIYRNWTMAGFQYTALIDSGADCCLFHADIGRILKIPINRGTRVPFVGIDGTEQIAYFHSVELGVDEWVVAIKAGFVEKLRWPYGVLGQEGFFDNFVVTHCNAPDNRFVEVHPIK